MLSTAMTIQCQWWMKEYGALLEWYWQGVIWRGVPRATCVHHKSQTNWPGIKPWSLWWKGGDLTCWGVARPARIVTIDLAMSGNKALHFHLTSSKTLTYLSAINLKRTIQSTLRRNLLRGIVQYCGWRRNGGNTTELSCSWLQINTRRIKPDRN
jgi:hypothetical protein